MTGVEDQLEETELVFKGLHEYHRRVTDRRQRVDEIEYNLQMAGQHLTDALSSIWQLGDDETVTELNDALHTVYRVDGESLDRGAVSEVPEGRRDRASQPVISTVPRIDSGWTPQ